jgi:O-antigen/teichoic acid export membrane protein
MATSLTVEGSNDESQLAQLGRRSLLHVLRLFTPVVVLIVAGAPLILAVFGRHYADAGTVLLRVLAPSTLAGAVIALYIGICQVRRHIGPIIGVQAGIFLLVLPTSWVLLPHYGILSVGIVWTASQSLVALVLLAFPLRRIIRPAHQPASASL